MKRSFNTLLARLLLGSAIPLVLFIGVALIATAVIFRLRDALQSEEYSRDVIRLALVQRQQLDQMRLAVRLFPLRQPEKLPENYQSSRAVFYRLAEQLNGLLGDNLSQQEQLHAVEELEKQWHQIVEAYHRELQERPGEPATDPTEKANAFDARSLTVMEPLQKAFQVFIDEEERLLRQRRDRTTQEIWQGFAVIIIALGTAISLTAGLSYLSARSVVRPIERLSHGANELMAGRLVMVPVSGPSEIARLIVHFNHMAITLFERASLLEKQEQRYRTYIGATSHLLWTTNAGGEVVAELPTWQGFTGQTIAQVRGLGWLDAIHPDDRPAIEKQWRGCITDRGIFEAECRLRSTAGEYRDFSCRAVPVLAADGSLREWIGTCTDITERKREGALRRAKDAAENANRAKSEFLTKMSHELRTPLNAVIGMSRMLLTQRFGGLNHKQADYLRDITQAGEHLLALINDILDLSKVEAGKMDINPEPFALNEAVTGLLSTVRSLADGKDVALHFAPPTDGTLTTDPARFRQVLLNLLSNAIKFTPGPGRVTVTCEWVDRVDGSATVVEEGQATAIRVAVSDTGIGIAPEEQSRVWEEFRQLKSGATQAQEGTGLGLALTRRLVRLLGGIIRLESTLGQGSTFTFLLPRQAPAIPVYEPSEAQTGRPLVLVIEDYPPTHKLLVDWLTGAGLATASAFDGEAGLDLARRLQPQLIVLDIRLPKRDGWQVLTDLKSDPTTAAMPVVIVTVTEDRHPASALGVQDYFVKPVERDHFLGRLRDAQPGLFRRDRPTRVLLAEDDPPTRTLVGDLLRAEGLVVVEAANGGEALELLKRERPDALVLDLIMPELDGFAVIETVRADPGWNNLPILVITAKDLTEEDRQRINGRIQALTAKHRLTPERLQQHLRDLGLVV